MADKFFGWESTAKDFNAVCPGCMWGHGASHKPGCPNAFKEFAAAEAGVAAAQRKEHPAQTMPMSAVHDQFNFDETKVQCPVCGLWGLHHCAPPPAPTLIGVLQDPIVSMIEFKGRLWVATTKGVFVKRENEDGFDPVELIPVAPATSYFWGKSVDKGRAADDAAGLVPLPDNQRAERADPFVPNKFGEH